MSRLILIIIVFLLFGCSSSENKPQESNNSVEIDPSTFPDLGEPYFSNNNSDEASPISLPDVTEGLSIDMIQTDKNPTIRILNLRDLEVSSHGVGEVIRLAAIDFSDVDRKFDLEKKAIKFLEFLSKGNVVNIEFEPSYLGELRHVYLFVDGVMLNRELVRKGYAKIDRIYELQKYLHILNEAEKEAIQGELGIWAGLKSDLNKDGLYKQEISPIGCGTLPCRKK